MNCCSSFGVLTCLWLTCAVFITGCQKATPPAPAPTITSPANSAAAEASAPANEEPSSPEPARLAEPVASSVSQETPHDQTPRTVVSAEGMNIQAAAQWDAPYVFGDPPNPLPLPKIEVRLLLEGGAAKEIFSIGKLRIYQAQIGDRVLRQVLDENQSQITEFEPVQLMQEPENGVDLNIDFAYPGEPIKSISSLIGEVDVIFAEQIKTFSNVKLGDLPTIAEKEPLLKAIGFSIAPPRKNILDEMDYIMTTGPTGVVTNFEIKDGEGNKSYDFSSGEFPVTGGCRYEDSFKEEELKTSTVSFTLATGFRKVTIPFEFREIPVAEMRKLSSNQVGFPTPDVGTASVYFGSETNTTLPKGLRVDGRVGWSPLYDYVAADHPSNSLAFAAFIELSGPQAQAIRAIDSVEVAKCLTDAGELTYEPPNGFSVLAYRLSFNKVVVPEGCPVSLRLPFKSPETPVKQCQELSGTVAVVLAKGEETLEFELDDAAGPLEHPTFKKLGMTARYLIEVPEDPIEEEQMSLKVVISMPDRQHLGRLFLSSPVEKEFLSSFGSEDGVTEFSSHYDAQKHPKPRLVFDLVTQIERETVPFRFLNLPIAALPTPAKP